jgi:hypothetical protein
MIDFIVYLVATGEILRIGTCPDESTMELQVEDSSQDVIEGTADPQTQKIEIDSSGSQVVNKTAVEMIGLPTYSLTYPDSVAYEGGSSWTGGSSAYDEDNATYADEVAHESKYIEFTWSTPLIADYWLIVVSEPEYGPPAVTAIKVELYYDSAWHTSYQADIAQYTWVAYPTLTVNYEISKVRVTCMLGGTTLHIHEIGLVPRSAIYSLAGARTGATRVAAGAILGEQWITAGHATLPDGVVMCEL